LALLKYCRIFITLSHSSHIQSDRIPPISESWRIGLKRQTGGRENIPTFVADSSFLYVELLSGALRRCQNYFEVVGQSVNSADAIRRLDEFEPAIALISVELQDGKTAGYRVLEHLRETSPETAAVAMLTEEVRDQVLEAFRCGARGVVSKNQPFRVVAQCLRKVHQGEIWASSDQISYVFDSLKGAQRPTPKSAGPFDELTPREHEVVARVIQGMSNAEIGTELGVTENTVRNYVMKIFDKLGVSNRVQLTRFCAPFFDRQTTQ
jgi:DNA-binding NarL/FixJ family response regulator